MDGMYRYTCGGCKEVKDTNHGGNYLEIITILRYNLQKLKCTHFECCDSEAMTIVDIQNISISPNVFLRCL